MLARYFVSMRTYRKRRTNAVEDSHLPFPSSSAHSTLLATLVMLPKASYVDGYHIKYNVCKTLDFRSEKLFPCKNTLPNIM